MRFLASMTGVQSSFGSGTYLLQISKSFSPLMGYSVIQLVNSLTPPRSTSSPSGVMMRRRYFFSPFSSQVSYLTSQLARSFSSKMQLGPV